MAEKTVSVQNTEQIWALFGNYDKNINTIQKHYNVAILSRGGDIKISGEPDNVNKAVDTIQTLLDMINRGETINEQTVRYVTSMVSEDTSANIKLKEFSSNDNGICITTSGKVVKAKTFGQKKYVDAIKNNTIVFGVGPAGTGKTYLAVALAVKSFKAHDVNRIILTRPAVEAGEKLGFLPGDLQDKVDPYLRPLYDGLSDMLGMESFQKFMEKGTIEVAPLAYMRGRTLENAFIILDEAQNTTPEQIKMFLTRLGNGSKMVITGDITQIDLPNKQKSGLIEALHVLKDVEDISIQKFSEKDVVRHKLVQDIIKAYEKYSNTEV
ncbi:MAG: PhoH family protein [Ruminococcus sp.]|nr:PhoH family protein [Ruminococcus sp.]